MTLSDTSPYPAAGEAPSADPFLALLSDCESADAIFSMSVPALASLTADLVARCNESIKMAVAQVASFRSALLSRKTRVLGCAKRPLRKQCKRIVAGFEAVAVSSEQLHVWAAVAGACPGLDCAFAASPLLASPHLEQAPVVALSSIFGLPCGGELGTVATGDGLRVVSAAGPGLKWFEPHSRNEFSMVLAQADGSVPTWLTTGDVGVDLLSPVGAGTPLTAATAVRSEWLPQATVTVYYFWGLNEDAPEAVLRVIVCGAAVADAAGDRSWCVRVPRRPLAGHECAAAGTHVRTLLVVQENKHGMAVSADEKWLVVGLQDEGTLSVYSLPGGELVRTFGGKGEGNGPLQFNGLYRLCFAPNGMHNLIVVGSSDYRLQEVTLEGEFVRFIGAGEFGDRTPFCVAVHDDVIAVGCEEGTGPRVVLFDFGTGEATLRFGELGTDPGQLSNSCTGIRFSPDGRHLIVAEYETRRLSLFTTAGKFVRCVGVGLLGGGMQDVLQSATGEFVVALSGEHRVCVFSPEGLELVRSWGVRGTGDGQFQYPSALAAAGHYLYVMDCASGRVQVFE